MDHHGPQVAGCARMTVQGLGVSVYVLLGRRVAVAVRQKLTAFLNRFFTKGKHLLIVIDGIAAIAVFGIFVGAAEPGSAPLGRAIQKDFIAAKPEMVLILLGVLWMRCQQRGMLFHIRIGDDV